MAFTYDPTKLTDPTVSPYYPPATVGQRNEVRLLIQDTVSSRPLFQDEEIDWSLTTAANVYMCAADLCDVLVAQSAGVKSKRISDFYITYDVALYTKLSGTLRARGMSHQVPYVGGISQADKDAQTSDSDWVEPRISRKQGDNPAGFDPVTNTSNNPLTQI